MARSPKLETFNLFRGTRIGRNFQVLEQIGAGWEGEVYLVEERTTGIQRAAKLFFPHRNPKNKTALIYSQKLHKLRECPIVVRYYSQEIVRLKNQEVTAVFSEYIRGEILSRFLARQPGKRLSHFAAIHLLYALASGLEQIHQMKEYHGDLHSENIMVEGFGLSFHIKVLDLYNWRAPRRQNIHDDICDMMQVFHESLGGARTYRKQRAEIKEIICGLKRGLILKKFGAAGALKNHLELLRWKV